MHPTFHERHSARPLHHSSTEGVPSIANSTSLWCNTWSGRFGLKRLLMELLNSNNKMCMFFRFDFKRQSYCGLKNCFRATIRPVWNISNFNFFFLASAPRHFTGNPIGMFGRTAEFFFFSRQSLSSMASDEIRTKKKTTEISDEKRQPVSGKNLNLAGRAVRMSVIISIKKSISFSQFPLRSHLTT